MQGAERVEVEVLDELTSIGGRGGEPEGEFEVDLAAAWGNRGIRRGGRNAIGNKEIEVRDVDES
jgi:hypothetical protein